MRVTATEASRRFSGLLSRVAAGETVEVDRHGEVVAVLSPPRRGWVSGDELVALLTNLPRPDSRFGTDVRDLARLTMGPRDPWQS
ncbi:MAG TPA: type II toxin-antitoxin system prevent-host-death family antitoxin [Candidatus Dormibacteraeota bacterium]|nr:type II toxin-antitoxin system prevent-host-death family antitoxin [Candidatus Dormibacteraeota bacterium]